MTQGGGERISKAERRAEREREGRRRTRRTWLLRGGAAALLLVPLLLWQVDRSGTLETLEAEVVAVRVWRHHQKDGRWHTHQAVTLSIGGVTHVDLDRADDLRRGQRVPVRVRRGRLSGGVYFAGRADVEPAAEPTD